MNMCSHASDALSWGSSFEGGYCHEPSTWSLGPPNIIIFQFALRWTHYALAIPASAQMLQDHQSRATLVTQYALLTVPGLLTPVCALHTTPVYALTPRRRRSASILNQMASRPSLVTPASHLSTSIMLVTLITCITCPRHLRATTHSIPVCPNSTHFAL